MKPFHANVTIRFIRYAAVGAMGTVAQYAVLIVIVESRVADAVTASVAGAVAGAIVNYLLNRRYTFRSSYSHFLAAPRFAVAAVAGILLNGLAMALLVKHAGAPYILAQLITSAAVLVLTFLINSLWTFKLRDR
jgi:putative flippase GtrA